LFAGAGVVVGKLSSADEGGEATHVCTMAMEAVVVLFNSEVRGGRSGAGRGAGKAGHVSQWWVAGV